MATDFEHFFAGVSNSSVVKPKKADIAKTHSIIETDTQNNNNKVDTPPPKDKNKSKKKHKEEEEEKNSSIVVDNNNNNNNNNNNDDNDNKNNSDFVKADEESNCERYYIIRQNTLDNYDLMDKAITKNVDADINNKGHFIMSKYFLASCGNDEDDSKELHLSRRHFVNFIHDQKRYHLLRDCDIYTVLKSYQCKKPSDLIRRLVTLDDCLHLRR